MKTFFNILQTVINIKHKKYPDDSFILLLQNNELHTGINSHIYSLINAIFYAEKNIHIKCQYIKNAYAKLTSLNTIIDNSFYEKQLKEEIISVFSKSQKTYYAFSKLARIYKIKKYPFVVTEDLSMNALDEKHKNTFMLIDNKSKYLFSLNDLISIIETSIGNAPNFFSQPLSCLNPYNNQPFTISTLYNIYFKMKESGRLISVLFHFFFLEHFCKFQFSEQYESYIRENSIKKYIFNSPYTTLYPYVFVMLEDNPYTKNYNIHAEFPKELLVNIFRPFLFYYYIIHYDIKGTNKVYNYKEILYIKLKKFYQYNKAFGRQYIHITKDDDKIIKKEYQFNTNHLNFYNICIELNLFNSVYFNIANHQLIAYHVSSNNIHNDDSSVDSTDDDSDSIS
jgi:hypothetical protein